MSGAGHKSATRTRRVVLAHGGGGQLTDQLLDQLIRPRLDNPLLAAWDDAALVPVNAGRLAMTTDSYVVRPLVFPGGDIGRLAVCGTVNDLAVCGAQPLALSLALIVEEGLELDLLGTLIDSIAATAEEAGVAVATGDTKVVGRGQADGLYINTAGVGLVRSHSALSVQNISPGDVVLINGPIADHGLAILLAREEGEGLSSRLASDVAPLGRMIGRLVDQLEGLVFMRDPTRGGLAGVLADLAQQSGWHLTVDEAQIPVRPETRYVADMLGIEPLDVANEGKVVMVVRPEDAPRALELLREDPLGQQAAIIGRFGQQRDGLCELVTEVGGRRVIQKPYGEQLPRIC